ncbi:lysylphosphatidylglycerol synthase transmembrane domain-containing protein [Blastococcus sp. PRF04-17]|uniref:lysylphosphatidylglycerol synthase transmembrane domain-containing protein n=1 Tax=Blastococcus sp. PRF04-17 TaxID=2933797 RepID=UPI001FF598E5|nr:lysylphosphatidylglycerol synthase transmembrane domain-containing protein [Blastococcus sp. PRF04-17]UOY01234.1 flippase-like domain-containing protein [Blastococcus sp. PRF04-17]
MGGSHGGPAEPPDGREGATSDEPAAARARRTGWRRLLRHAFVAAVVVALVLVLWGQRETVAESLGSMSPATLATSLLFAMVAAALPGLVWRDLLTSQGYPTPRITGLRAFFVAQLGKYLPGGIWNLVAQVAMARDLRIPGRQGATATFLVLALSVITSLLVAALTLAFAVPELLAEYWWAFAVVPVLFVLLLPPSVTWWSGTAFRLLRRPGRPIVLSAGDLLRAALLLCLSWTTLGVHFGFLVRELGPDTSAVWLLSVGVYALAWVAGLLVVFAPAGAGVREAVLVLGFAAFLPAGPLLAVAVLSRVLLVLADVLLAAGLVAAAWFPLGRRRTGPAPDPR